MRAGGSKTTTRTAPPKHGSNRTLTSVPRWTEDAARLLDLVAQLMSKTLSRRLLQEMPEARQIGLSLPQLQALRYLWLHTNVCMGELADGLDISYPSATNMVKRLSDKGLVERLINAGDRREVDVILTEDGRALIVRVEEKRIARLTQLLERMEEADRAALFDGLRRLVSLAVEDDAGAAHEICLRCGWRATETCPIAEIIPLFPCE